MSNATTAMNAFLTVFVLFMAGNNKSIYMQHIISPTPEKTSRNLVSFRGNHAYKVQNRIVVSEPAFYQV